MGTPKQMIRDKKKTPKKKVRNQRVTYSSARKKKGSPDFHYANGKHTNGGNSFLREDATTYHTQFTAVLDVAPPIIEIETPIVDESPSPETLEALGHIERLNFRG